MSKIEDTNEENFLLLRAHHGMCLAYFKGEGYSGSFAAHMGEIKALLEADPGKIVRITDGPDEICSACPELKGGVCESNEKSGRYDAGVLAMTGTAAGKKLSWREYRDLVRQMILLPGRRGEICGDCRWNELCRDLR